MKVSASFEPNLDLAPEIRTEIGYSARRGGCYEVKRSSPKGEKISHGVKGYPQKVTLVGTNLLQSAVQKYVMCVPHQKVSMKLKFPELKEKWQVVKLDMILVSLKSCLAKFDLFILATLDRPKKNPFNRFCTIKELPKLCDFKIFVWLCWWKLDLNIYLYFF